MSEEEKKVYEELKKEINKPLEIPEDKCNTFILYNIDNAKIILNLIEKQQKEIEELKVINQMQKYRIETIDERELVSKDKIREKIKELENVSYAECIESAKENIKLLQELLKGE